MSIQASLVICFWQQELYGIVSSDAIGANATVDITGGAEKLQPNYLTLKMKGRLYIVRILAYKGVKSVEEGCGPRKGTRNRQKPFSIPQGERHETGCILWIKNL